MAFKVGDVVRNKLQQIPTGYTYMGSGMWGAMSFSIPHGVFVRVLAVNEDSVEIEYGLYRCNVHPSTLEKLDGIISNEQKD